MPKQDLLTVLRGGGTLSPRQQITLTLLMVPHFLRRRKWLPREFKYAA